MGGFISGMDGEKIGSKMGAGRAMVYALPTINIAYVFNGPLS